MRYRIDVTLTAVGGGLWHSLCNLVWPAKLTWQAMMLWESKVSFATKSLESRFMMAEQPGYAACGLTRSVIREIHHAFCHCWHALLAKRMLMQG